MHDIQKLLFSRIVNLPNFSLHLVKPILNGIQLGRVRRQEENLHITGFSHIGSLLLIVYRTIIKYQPLLSHILLLVALLFSELVHLLLQSQEELLYEVEVFVFAVCAFDDSPVGQSVLGDDCNQGKSFAFGDWTVYSDFLVRPCPCFVTSHIKIKATFVQKVYFGLLHPNVFVLYAVIVPFFKRFCCVSLFRYTLNSFLLEFAHFQ